VGVHTAVTGSGVLRSFSLSFTNQSFSIPLYPSIYPSIDRSIYPSIHLWVGAYIGAAWSGVLISIHKLISPPPSLSIYPPICLFIYASIYLRIYPSIYLSDYPSIYPSIYPSTPLSIYPSIYLSGYPIYLYVHLSVYLSICFIHRSGDPSIYLPSIDLSIYPSIHLSIYLDGAYIAATWSGVLPYWSARRRSAPFLTEDSMLFTLSSWQAFTCKKPVVRNPKMMRGAPGRLVRKVGNVQEIASQQKAFTGRTTCCKCRPLALGGGFTRTGPAAFGRQLHHPRVRPVRYGSTAGIQLEFGGGTARHPMPAGLRTRYFWALAAASAAFSSGSFFSGFLPPIARGAQASRGRLRWTEPTRRNLLNFTTCISQLLSIFFFFFFFKWLIEEATPT